MYPPSSREDSEIDHYRSDTSENYDEDDDVDYDDSGEEVEDDSESGSSSNRRTRGRTDPGYSSARSSSQELGRESSEFSDVSNLFNYSMQMQ